MLSACFAIVSSITPLFERAYAGTELSIPAHNPAAAPQRKKSRLVITRLAAGDYMSDIGVMVADGDGAGAAACIAPIKIFR